MAHRTNGREYDELQALYKNYPNLNVVEQTGKGVSQARNQIIKNGRATLCGVFR